MRLDDPVQVAVLLDRKQNLEVRVQITPMTIAKNPKMPSPHQSHLDATFPHCKLSSFSR